MEVAMTDIALPAGLPSQEPHNESYLELEQAKTIEIIAPVETLDDDRFENPEVSHAKDEIKEADDGVLKEETQQLPSTVVAVEHDVPTGSTDGEAAEEVVAPEDETAQLATAAPEGNPEEAVKDEGDQSTMETQTETTSASNAEDNGPSQPNDVVLEGADDGQDSKPAAAETNDAGASKLPEGSDPTAMDEDAGTNVEDVEVRRHKKKGEVLKRPQDSTTVVTRNGKTWIEMFDVLAAYKEKFGDCCVADRFKWEGVCLGLWVRNQRRREASLTDEQHRRLSSLGLDWQTQNERFDATWHERYAKLTEYRVENGDCKVPYTYKKDPALAKWVSQQRAQQAQGRLASDRKAKLDAIDFSWKLNTVKNRNTKTEDKKWTRQYEKLVAFHQQHGHCKVPDRYKPDKPLGTWVKKQRLANACDQLKDDRKQMLDDLGFVWRITDKTDAEKWDRMFDQLKTYKEENGTCHVSRTVPDNDLKPLARWVKTQRALHKAGKILDDRKMRLESIHFVWDGTQLPIKRKRRRQVEEGEKQKNGQPAKRAKTEDGAAVKNEDGEDSKTVATIPPQEPESKSASTVAADDPVTVIVDAATNVDGSDMKPKAREVANEMELGDGNTELETTNIVNAATDSAVAVAASDNQSINSSTAKPTDGTTTVSSENEENRGTAAGGTSNEQNTELQFKLTNGNDGNGSKAASQTIGDVMTQTSAPLTTDINDKPELEANCDEEEGHESAQATNDVAAGLEGYGAEGEAEETFAPMNAESPRRESPARRRKRGRNFN